MDDPLTPENQTPSQDINSPVSSTPPSTEPESIAPPSPGQVVSSGSAGGAGGQSSAYGAGPAGGAPPPPKVVTSGNGGGRRGLKVLIIIIILALLGAGGWYAYTKYIKKSPAPSTPTQSKSIPLLKIGIQQADYGKLYPDMSVNEYGYLINAQIFEGLVRYENKSKIAPDLASTWTNPDSKTWLFTIRSGVKFHDGHTLAASDVKYSIDTVMASKSDLAQTFASTIASVDVVGNNQVKITTNTPDPALLNRLAFLYVIDANSPKGDDPSQAGTGPYEIKPGTKPTDTHVQMVAFNGYHGGVPTTKALDFGGSDDAASLVKAFNSHQYNIVGPVPTSDAQAAKGATKFVTTEPDVRYLAFNTVKPGPLQNKLVREAVRYAVNPTAIAKASGNQATPISQLIPESIPGYNPAIAPYKQDIAKAKQLLAQAGYPNGLTVRFSTADEPKETAEVVNELKQAGITATVDQHNDFDEFINYFSNGQADMYITDYASDTLDGLDIYTTALSSPNYNSPQVTALLDQASTTTDPAKRLKLLQDATALIDKDIAIVPLSTQNDVWLMDKPYAIQQDMPSSLISVYFYKVHQ